MNHRIKRITLLPLAAALAALSACHQGGIGVDTSTSQKAATGAESGLKGDRSIRSGTTAQATVQMPAAALMQSALTQWGSAEMSKMLPGGAAAGLWSQLLDSEHTAGPSHLSELMQQTSQAAASAMHQPSPHARYLHAAAALYIATTAQPMQGWPFRCMGCQDEAAWARWSAQNVIFTNTLLTQIASAPALRQALADPAAARAAIVRAFLSITPAQIDAAWQQAGQQVQGRSINFDFTGSGPAPVHYIIGSNDFQASPTGWKWSMSGVPWFGEGRVSGKDVELSLASAIDKSMSQTSTTSTSTSTATEQGAGGSAGVK